MRFDVRTAVAGAVALLALGGAGCDGGGDRSPDVLLYLIDALRPDRLGCYGYDRPTSPNIDAFAAGAVRFENAWTTSTWTRPAVSSLMTGLYPASHGVHVMSDRLDARFETLAERFRAAGYQTFAVTANGMVSGEYGLDRGFDEMRRIRGEEPEKTLGRRAEFVHDEFLRWIDSRRDPDRPFFAYIHVIDPHAPFLPPEAERQRLAPEVDPRVGIRERFFPLIRREREATAEEGVALRALYDAEVAYADARFGGLLGDLDRRQLLDRMVVALTADHGEELGERGGWGHGTNLFEEQLRIPMLLRVPRTGAPGSVSSERAQILDLFPTLLEAARLEPSTQAQGRSLLSSRPEATPRPVWGLLLSNDRSWEIESVLLDGMKLHRTRSPTLAGPAVALFDLRSDRGEAHDLASASPDRLRPLLHQLADLHRRHARSSSAPSTADAELAGEMRALGYVGGGANGEND